VQAKSKAIPFTNFSDKAEAPFSQRIPQKTLPEAAGKF